MTATAGRADRSTLNAVTGNLDTGDVADPALRLAFFQYMTDLSDANYDYTAGLISAGTLSRLGIINVKDYNASGDGDTTTTGSITSGSKALTVASTSTFAQGQGISVAGAGAAGVDLVTTIASISGLVVNLVDAAGTTVSGATVSHDDTAAFQAAVDVVTAAGTEGVIYFPPGDYILTSGLDISNSIRMMGSGVRLTTIICNGIFTALNFTGESLRMEHILFRQSGGNVRCVNAVKTGGGVFLKFSNCTFNYFTNHAIYAEDLIDSQFIQCAGTGPYSSVSGFSDSPDTTTTRTSNFIQFEGVVSFSTTVTFDKCYFNWWRHGIYSINSVLTTVTETILEANWIGIYAPRDDTRPNGGPSQLLTIRQSWFESNYHTTYGAGLFGDLADITNSNLSTSVSIENVYQKLPDGRDQFYGVMLVRPFRYNGTTFDFNTRLGANESGDFEPTFQNNIAGTTNILKLVSVTTGRVLNSVTDPGGTAFIRNLVVSGAFSYMHELKSVSNVADLSVYRQDSPSTYGFVRVRNLTIFVGTTANRPSASLDGILYYDTTIGKLLVSLSAGWKLADGSAASNFGNATILSGNTSIVVTHGMSTPTCVIATPEANLGSIWITSIGATTFTINCSNAAVADTVISWIAKK